ncbi:hypothetical protein [Bacillus swezeyi]|uniref:hypothetical protein n=1 Tax=Bacillus swezeyi TaxID=1925020 RepID=UPI0027DE9824|nr:hypothetical protein [Bacillus swezeyi]
MNWFEFVSAIIQSLAWPVTLIMFVLLLKEPLSERMKELIKLKYKDFELEFDQKIQALASARKKTPAVMAAGTAGAVIENAWFEVEEALRQAAKKLDARGEHQEVQLLIQMLHEQGALTKETVFMLSELSNLKRHAVLNEASFEGALAYKKLCREEAEKIRSMAEKQTAF